MQSAMFLLIVRPTPFLSRRLSKKIEWARRKPGSVSDNHLSWLPVTRKLMRPTYRAATGRRFFCPIWSCSEWGYTRNMLPYLPVSSYLTISTLHGITRLGGMFLLHFPYSYLRRTLSGILALRSPDFPHTSQRCTRLSALPKI